MTRYKGDKTWIFGQTIMKKLIDSDVYCEFQSVCKEIGVEEHVMLTEVIKEFNKDMRKAQKYKLKTVYGDIFPTDGKK
tara:strand:+ start:961 stop:1194 length:234 start_codon:yes stop_codon:yes gene_type:complete